VSGIDYEIHLYRPRIEGLFSGIERWVNVNTGVSHWRTITTSNVTTTNVTTLYGYDNLSSITDPSDPHRLPSHASGPRVLTTEPRRVRRPLFDSHTFPTSAASSSRSSSRSRYVFCFGVQRGSS
jgi:hypothetical protein